MMAEAWYLHDESKHTFPYNFASVVDALHVSIRADHAHDAHLPPTPALLESEGAHSLSSHSARSLHPSDTLYQGPKRYGRPQSVTNEGADERGNTLACFNVERPTCRVSSCPFHKNRAKIESNLELWRMKRRIKRGASSIHAVDIPHLMMPSTVETEVLFEARFLRSDTTSEIAKWEDGHASDADEDSNADVAHLRKSDADIFIFDKCSSSQRYMEVPAALSRSTSII